MKWICTFIAFTLFSFLHAASNPFTPPANPPPPTFQASYLPVVLVNNTNLPDDEVYVVVLGTQTSAPFLQCFVQFNASGIGTLVAAEPGDNATNYSLTFNQLPATPGGRVVYLPNLSGGVVFISLERALSMPVNAPNGIVEPPPTDTGDVNYNTIWDQFELAYVPNPPQIFANATAVSQFTLPLYGYISTPDIPNQNTTGLYEPRPYIFSELTALFSSAPEAAQWTRLPLLSTTSPTQQLRIMSTGKSTFANSPPPTFDLNYFDNFAAYGYSFIEDIWTGPSSFYRLNPLTMTIPNGSFQTYTGVIQSDNTIVLTSNGIPSAGAPPDAPTGIYTVVFSTPTTTTATTTQQILSGLIPPQYFVQSDNSPGQQDGVQLTKLFEECVIAGLVPTAETLSNPFILANSSNYYTINANLSPTGKTTGPWYDLYSKGLHSLGFIYTYAFDEPLFPQVQISSNTLIANQTYLSITVGPVDPTPTNTTVASSLNPSTFGDSVTFTATVVGENPQAQIATGAVQFSIDGSNVGSPVTLVNGQASYTTASLSVGTHPVIATYIPDVSFVASVSAALNQVVNAAVGAETTTTLVSSLNPATEGQLVTFTATVTSAEAGMPTGSVIFTIDGVEGAPVALVNQVATFQTSTLSVGSHTLTATYSGDENFQTSVSAPLVEVINPQTGTTTTLTSSLNPSLAGQLVTFTATVASDSGLGFPTGTVTFSVDSLPSQPVTLVNGVALFSTSSLSTGSHTIVATYSGDVNFLASTSAPLTQEVDAVLISTTTTVSGSPNPGRVTESVTFTATVVPTSGEGIPSGSVIFSIDGTAQTPVPLVNGVGTLETSSLTIGNHTIIATYSGDSSYSGSTSDPYIETIVFENRTATTTTLTSSENPAQYGTSLTFTATVMPTTGPGTPTGSVVFRIDGVAMTPVPLVDGVATLSTSTLSIGDHQIFALYSGDDTFSPSLSPGLIQVINPVQTATTTMLSSSLNPAVFGQQVTFTASVTGEGVTATPTGSVTFTVDSVPGSPVTLVNGQASFSTSSLSVGDHTITAVYSGDINFLGSTSPPLTQVITAALIETTTTVVGAPNPGEVGDVISFTATVVDNTAMGTPTGSVTFYIDNVAQAPQTLTNGTATLLVSDLSLGDHMVYAVYSGDATYAASTSETITEVINPQTLIETTSTVVSSLNPATVGQTVIFTVTVTETAGSDVPSGNIRFNVDGVFYAPIALLNGQASLATSLLTVGNHAIYAVYLGNETYRPSLSNTVIEVINPIVRTATTTTVVSSINPSLVGELVTFTATVTSNEGLGTPTGSVVFTIDGTPGNPILLTGGEANFSTALLTAGNHTITVGYSGDTLFLPSTSTPLTQVVDAVQSPTTTTVVGSPNPAGLGEDVIFTATVVDQTAMGTPTGTVTFSIDSVLQPPLPLVNGVATLITSTLSLGDHIIIATYSGSPDYLISISPPYTEMIILDTRTASRTTLESSLNPASVGEPVTFTATVAPAAGVGVPTGNVRFDIDGVLTAPIALVDGTASYMDSSLSIGEHTIFALYLGDSTFRPSYSTSITQVINPVAVDTTTSISSSKSPSRRGETVNFTARVTSNSGEGIPTGSVIFTLDGVQQSPLPLINGVAVFSTSTLSLGNHLIFATYSGDVNFNGSTSPQFTQIVLPGVRVSTTTTLVSSLNPSFIDQSVTFTATVEGASGSLTPTGTVRFNIDGVLGSPIILTDGQAAFTTNALSVGEHVVFALYSGDIDFFPSQSKALTQVVLPRGQIQTTTTLTSSLNPAFTGDSVTFTATVLSALEIGIPGGSVTFSIDGILGTPVELVNGIATFTTSTLSTGFHTVQAFYSGSEIYFSSESEILQEQIVALLPPSHLTVKQVKNKFATQTDRVNSLRWKAPSKGPTPVAYEIYRDAALTERVAVVPASRHAYGSRSNFKYEDHNRRPNHTYHYYVVSISRSGEKSLAAEVSIKERGSSS